MPPRKGVTGATSSVFEEGLPETVGEQAREPTMSDLMAVIQRMASEQQDNKTELQGQIASVYEHIKEKGQEAEARSEALLTQFQLQFRSMEGRLTRMESQQGRVQDQMQELRGGQEPHIPDIADSRGKVPSDRLPPLIPTPAMVFGSTSQGDTGRGSQYRQEGHRGQSGGKLPYVDSRGMGSRRETERVVSPGHPGAAEPERRPSASFTKGILTLDSSDEDEELGGQPLQEPVWDRRREDITRVLEQYHLLETHQKQIITFKQFMEVMDPGLERDLWTGGRGDNRDKIILNKFKGDEDVV